MNGMGNAARTPLVDQVYRELQRRIRSKELTPGKRLPTEKQLTDQFGVSRTVLREAIARLSADGMVKAHHGTGVYVSDTAHYEAFQITRDELSTYEYVSRLLELRMAIEAEMAGMAATRRSEADVIELRRLLAAIGEDPEDPDSAIDADAELHIGIARAAGNEYFERFVGFLGIRLVPKRTLTMRGNDRAQQEVLLATLHGEHVAIVDAIAAGDAPAARAAARTHIVNSIERHDRAAAEARAAINTQPLAA